MRTLALWLALAVPAQAGIVETVLYRGDAAGQYNGVMGFNQALLYGNPSAATVLGDNDDNTGIYFPPSTNVYGGPLASALGVLPFYDGRILGTDTVLAVKFRMRVRCTLPNTRIQLFVHREIFDPAEAIAWGDLFWQSSPTWQTPLSPPYPPRDGEVWDQLAWTWVEGDFYNRNGLGLPWTPAGIFRNSYGIWALPPVGGSVYVSEWELRVTVDHQVVYDTCGDKPSPCIRFK